VDQFETISGDHPMSESVGTRIRPPGLIAGPGPELVFGLVGAVGTDLGQVSQALSQQLSRVGYAAHEIRVSALLHSLDRYNHLSTPTSGSEYVRIKAHMTAGSELRKLAQKGDMLALMAVAQIRQLRRQHGDVRDGERPRTPLSRTAYIIRSIKHPSEIDTLRDIYGRAFFVVSAYSPRSKRVSTLATLIAESEGDPDHASFRGKAEELIRIDEEEEDAPLGQDVRDSFPQGDVFVDVRGRDRLNQSLERFIDAVFGNPFVTPTPDEFGMFHANSAALRSADLGRQVGAAVATHNGEIAALGCNDVPRAGGGQYWSGDEPDARDFQLGFDSSARFRQKMTTELTAKLLGAGWIPPEGWEREPQKLAERIADRGVFKGTRLQNLLEYGRAVHAEMAAITDAARRGVSIKDSTLYSTTFPCHLCARHIIAAGIRRVVYIEPYPKSAAEELYGDSLTVDAEERSGTKVAFEPFVGISPNLYLLAFGFVPDSRKDSRGDVRNWQPAKAEPRLKQFVASYLLIEDTVLDTVLPAHFDRMDIHPMIPEPNNGSLAT
jgi:deoxycytidylate deaminase